MDTLDFSLDLSSLEQAKSPEESVTYDLLILGGGPAAMSAAIYAARKMMNLAIITRDFGGQVRETSIVENWPGFQTIDAKELASMFEEHIKTFDVPVSMGAAIIKVVKDHDLIKAALDNGQTFSGRTAIIALGMHHRTLGVPGEKELAGKGVAYCATCDAPLYKGRQVVVIGGGNSAFTTALDLIKVDAEVTIINFAKGWQADAVIKQRVQDKVKLLDNHQVVAIEGRDKVSAVVIKNRETSKESRIEAEGVFVDIGLLSNSEPVKDLVKLNGRGEILVDCSCHTSAEGVFAAGDITTVPYKQIIISAGEGSKAALAAYDYLVGKGQL